MCVDCGRRLKRAAYTIAAQPGVHNGGALGPTCAARRGLIEPKRAQLNRKPRARKAKAASAQMEMADV